MRRDRKSRCEDVVENVGQNIAVEDTGGERGGGTSCNEMCSANKDS